MLAPLASHVLTVETVTGETLAVVCFFYCIISRSLIGWVWLDRIFLQERNTGAEPLGRTADSTAVTFRSLIKGMLAEMVAFRGGGVRNALFIPTGEYGGVSIAVPCKMYFLQPFEEFLPLFVYCIRRSTSNITYVLIVNS